MPYEAEDAATHAAAVEFLRAMYRDRQSLASTSTSEHAFFNHSHKASLIVYILKRMGAEL